MMSGVGIDDREQRVSGHLLEVEIIGEELTEGMLPGGIACPAVVLAGLIAVGPREPARREQQVGLMLYPGGLDVVKVVVRDVADPELTYRTRRRIRQSAENLIGILRCLRRLVANGIHRLLQITTQPSARLEVHGDHLRHTDHLASHHAETDQRIWPRPAPGDGYLLAEHACPPP